MLIDAVMAVASFVSPDFQGGLVAQGSQPIRYDALNRLAQKTYPDSTSVEYVYDLVGKVQQISDPTGRYGFAYDASAPLSAGNMGRLVGSTT